MLKTRNRPIKNTPERFWAKAVPAGECWEWTGAKDHWGYGEYSIGSRSNRKKWRTNRYSWTIVNGPIPDGMFVCHACDNPACVRPDHLFLGSHSDNMRDMSSKGRTRGRRQTHCSRGHEFNEENTRVLASPNGPGVRRFCRRCDAIRQRECKSRKMAGAL